MRYVCRGDIVTDNTFIISPSNSNMTAENRYVNFLIIVIFSVGVCVKRLVAGTTIHSQLFKYMRVEVIQVYDLPECTYFILQHSELNLKKKQLT